MNHWKLSFMYIKYEMYSAGSCLNTEPQTYGAIMKVVDLLPSEDWLLEAGHWGRSRITQFYLGLHFLCFLGWHGGRSYLHHVSSGEISIILIVLHYHVISTMTAEFPLTLWAKIKIPHLYWISCVIWTSQCITKWCKGGTLNLGHSCSKWYSKGMFLNNL